MLTRLTCFFLGLCLIMSSVSAQERNTQQRTAVPLLSVLWCDEPAKMFGLLEGKYNEMPMMQGKASVQEQTTGQFLNFEIMFYYNKDTNTWSIVGVIPNIENTKACMLLNGAELEPFVRGDRL